MPDYHTCSDHSKPPPQSQQLARAFRLFLHGGVSTQSQAWQLDLWFQHIWSIRVSFMQRHSSLIMFILTCVLQCFGFWTHFICRSDWWHAMMTKNYSYAIWFVWRSVPHRGGTQKCNCGFHSECFAKTGADKAQWSPDNYQLWCLVKSIISIKSTIPGFAKRYMTEKRVWSDIFSTTM